jgi:hypothetical protein
MRSGFFLVESFSGFKVLSFAVFWDLALGDGYSLKGSKK